MSEKLFMSAQLHAMGIKDHPDWRRDKRAIVRPDHVYADPDSGHIYPEGHQLNVSSQELWQSRGVLAEIGSYEHEEALRVFAEREAKDPKLGSFDLPREAHTARNRMIVGETAKASKGAVANTRD